MSRRFALLVLAAMVVLAAAVWVAVVLPDGCPEGFHIRGVVCLSNGTHLAPSSGVRIPDAQTGLDNRWTVRVDLVFAGTFIAGGLLFAASRSIHARPG